MSVELAIELYREMLRTAALVATPILATAMGVGLVISLAQTLTSLQEQTLSFVPKIAAIALVIGFALPWMLDALTSFLALVIQQGPAVVALR
jgi:flagellar biosynthetic protein FliQ